MNARGKKIRAAILAVLALGGIGTGAGLTVIGSEAPPTPGSHGGGLVSDFNRGANLVVSHPGDANLTSYLTPLEIKLIDGNATNKQLQTGLAGLQTAITAAQNSPDATAQQKQQFASLEQALSAAKMLVKDKAIVPLNAVSGIKTVLDNEAKDKIAAEDLGKAIWANNPAADAFVASLVSNHPALDAIAGVTAATVKLSPEGQAFFGGLSPAAKAKISQDINLLSKLNKTDFTMALSATQAAITASLESSQVTPQQQQYLGTIQQLVTELNPVVHNGGISYANLQALRKIFSNKQQDEKYVTAVKSLIKDYEAGNLPAFAPAFKANDPTLLSLAKAFIPNSAVIGSVEQSAAKALDAPGASHLGREFGVSSKRNAAAKYLRTNGSSRLAAAKGNTYRRGA